MTLRRRLALTLLLTAIPLFLGFAWARSELNRRYEVQTLRENVQNRANWLGRERCESAPAEFGGPPRGERPGGPPPGGPPPGGPRPPGDRRGPGPPRRPPPRTFVYDASFRSQDPRAPEFPLELKQAFEGGAAHASRRYTPDSGRGEGLEVAVRTDWSDGPCAFIVAQQIEPPGEPPIGLVGNGLLLLSLLLASVLIAAGPIVQRIRGLTGEVRRSADTRYETPVRTEGGDEIAELARAFNDAGAKVRAQLVALEERDRTLRAFLADTTHDVMIPLTVLLGHLSNLRARLADAAPLQEAQLVPAIQEAQYLASLIQNLGAAAKLEAGEPLIENHAVDLNALVERVVERHRPVADPAGVALEFGVPERPALAWGDVTLIEQALNNVVHNAVRYNRRGGHVAVLLEEIAPGGFRLRVVDDGPGVPDEELQHLVERRRRGNEARQRHPGGLGLGLHIASRVAERHGFLMRFVRSEYGGLEVTIAGPRVTDETPAKA